MAWLSPKAIGAHEKSDAAAAFYRLRLTNQTAWKARFVVTCHFVRKPSKKWQLSM